MHATFSPPAMLCLALGLTVADATPHRLLMLVSHRSTRRPFCGCSSASACNAERAKSLLPRGLRFSRGMIFYPQVGHCRSASYWCCFLWANPTVDARQAVEQRLFLHWHASGASPGKQAAVHANRVCSLLCVPISLGRSAPKLFFLSPRTTVLRIYKSSKWSHRTR